MRLIAVFESWHIGDGNYPPFDKDQQVRLSFELDNAGLELASASAPSFTSNDDATCAFHGKVLGKYRTIVLSKRFFERWRTLPGRSSATLLASA
jgi:hypothetical protein